MSETNKVAIITGASRGIGSAIAQRLAADGHAVVVNYAGNSDAAARVVELIEAKGGKSIAVAADVSTAKGAQSLFAAAKDHFGGCDVLVNNAGIMKLATLRESADDLFDSQVAVNLKGTFNMLREGAEQLRSGGSIVNLSTSVVGLKLEAYGVYAATKAAVETLGAILAKELRGRSITVNSIAPGPTATELFFEGKSDELIARISKANPLERLGTPEDIANAVSFLVGNDGRWINGQTLRANGGMI